MPLVTTEQDHSKIALFGLLIWHLLWIFTGYAFKIKQWRNNNMGFSKTIVSGSAGSIVASASAGGLSLTIQGSKAFGQGKVANVLSVSSTDVIEIGDQQLVDLAFEYLAGKIPSISAEIMAAKALVDAELSKV